MAYDKKAVARRLKSLRADKGLDQSQLAIKTGVSRDVIHKYETAQTTPRLDTAFAMTEALGCSLEKLVCREEEGGSK